MAIGSGAFTVSTLNPKPYASGLYKATTFHRCCGKVMGFGFRLPQNLKKFSQSVEELFIPLPKYFKRNSEDPDSAFD